MTPAAHRDLLSTATPSTWAVDGKGRLLMQREGEARLETAACEVLTKEVIDPKTGVASPPGDVLLTRSDRRGSRTTGWPTSWGSAAPPCCDGASGMPRQGWRGS